MEDSIVVIQCAASKRSDTGYLLRTVGRGDIARVMFVAQPDLAPENDDHIYAHPDDQAQAGLSWREELMRYNADDELLRLRSDAIKVGGNPLELRRAWRLYTHPIYEELYRKFGPDNLYILSAGWGIIRADFLVPNYDITFSGNAEKYKRRGKRDTYDDFRMLPENTNNPIVFFGGKDYVNLFCELTSQVQGPRYVFYNSVNPPDAPGCRLHRFDTSARTNWHYTAARAYAEGRVGL